MILVDVLVPALERCYDFELDEGTAVGELIREISALLEQKEHLESRGTERLQLYAFSGADACESNCGAILNREETLKQAGVQSGNQLVLI